LCVSKSLLGAEKVERERHLMFTAAWQTFVSCAKLDDKILVESVVDDLLSSIDFLVWNTCPAQDCAFDIGVL